MSGQRGFTLAELVIAAGLMAAVSLVLLQLASGAQRSAVAMAGAADMEQRLRVALEAIAGDLQAAGAVPGRVADAYAADAVPAVRPARAGARGADPELFFSERRVTITYAPAGAPQATLRADVPPAGLPLSLDTAAASCGTHPSCGFAVGTRVLLAGPGGAGAVADVSAVAPGELTTDPSVDHFPAGSTVAGVVQRVYAFDPARSQISLYDGGAAEAPLVDHVSELRFRYFGEDPLDPAAPLRELPSSTLTDGPLIGRAPFRYDVDLRRIRRVDVAIAVFAAGRASGGDVRRATVSVAVRSARGR